MFFKKFVPLILISFSTFLFAEEPVNNIKIYGYIRNDFYFNSRINSESIDGLFYLYPKPVSLNSANVDVNAVPQAEMLSVNSRVGIDLNGSMILGAKSSARIETDFAGFGASYYVIRLRQAYIKLNWEKTELLLGQTWHPLYGNVIPTVVECDAGAPFQPNNRSPQIRIIHNLSSSVSLLGAAVYEMQYLSQGPLGPSACYLKNAMVPDLFLGSEYKTTHWTSGISLDFKTIKPSVEEISSLSAAIYTQYTNPKFQLKAKSFLGENLTDQQMLSGYGVSGIHSSNNAATYTNFNVVSSWINAVYGKTWQVGAFIGLSQNLGTNKSLLANANGKFTVYGNGIYDKSVLNPQLKITDAGYYEQVMLDRLYRISPHVSYNLPNFNIGMEYDFTAADYGTLQNNGRVASPYTVRNHRVVATVMYLF
jgi:hypothetical protein